MTLIHETIISAYTHTYTYIDNNQNKLGIGIFKCLIVFSLWHIYICICFVLVFCEYFGVIQELKSSWTRCSSHSVPWMYPRAAHAQNGSRKPPLRRCYVRVRVRVCVLAVSSRAAVPPNHCSFNDRVRFPQLLLPPPAVISGLNALSVIHQETGPSPWTTNLKPAH